MMTTKQAATTPKTRLLPVATLDISHSGLCHCSLLYNYCTSTTIKMSPIKTQKRTAPSPWTSASSRSKSSKSSSVSSPSASASTSAGFTATDKKLRSVLAHPIGLPLAASLNESGQLKSDLCQLYPDIDYRPLGLDEIFSSAAKEWNGQREVDLTAKLLTELNKSEVAACAEKVIRGVDANGDDRRGKVDLFLGSDTSTEKPQSIVTVIEVGLGNIEWWKKVDQGVTYAELLGDAQNKTFCFKKAMLLAVITVEKVGTSVEELKSLKARFGVFLCIPKGSKDSSDFRMSLLWQESAFQMLWMHPGGSGSLLAIRVTSESHYYLSTLWGYKERPQILPSGPSGPSVPRHCRPSPPL